MVKEFLWPSSVLWTTNLIISLTEEKSQTAKRWWLKMCLVSLGWQNALPRALGCLEKAAFPLSPDCHVIGLGAGEGGLWAKSFVMRRRPNHCHQRQRWIINTQAVVKSLSETLSNPSLANEVRERIKPIITLEVIRTLLNRKLKDRKPRLIDRPLLLSFWIILPRGLLL